MFCLHERVETPHTLETPQERHTSDNDDGADDKPILGDQRFQHFHNVTTFYIS